MDIKTLIRKPKRYLLGIIFSTALLVIPFILPASDIVPSAVDIYESLKFDGVIEPNKIVDVGSAVDGIIASIKVDRSDKIDAGQELAKLESRVEQATFELSRVQAKQQAVTDLELRYVNKEFNKRQYERMDRLFKKQVISLEQKDQSKTEADLARLQLRQAADNKKLAELEMLRAKELLRRRTVHSPISGVVIERFKSEGEYVEDTPILRIAEIDPLRVEVIVPAELYDRLHKGMRAEIIPETQPDISYKSEITIKDKVIDAASGTFGVRLMLPNPGYKIPGGMRCKVQFIEESIVEEDDEKPNEDEAEAKLVSFAINPNIELDKLEHAKANAIKNKKKQSKGISAKRKVDLISFAINPNIELSKLGHVKTNNNKQPKIINTTERVDLISFAINPHIELH